MRFLLIALVLVFTLAVRPVVAEQNCRLREDALLYIRTSQGTHQLRVWWAEGRGWDDEKYRNLWLQTVGDPVFRLVDFPQAWEREWVRRYSVVETALRAPPCGPSP